MHLYNSIMGSYLLQFFPYRSFFRLVAVAQVATLDVERWENSIRNSIKSNNLFSNSPNTFAGGIRFLASHSSTPQYCPEKVGIDGLWILPCFCGKWSFLADIGAIYPTKNLILCRPDVHRETVPLDQSKYCIILAYVQLKTNGSDQRAFSCCRRP